MRDDIKALSVNFDGIIDYIRDKDIEILNLQYKLKHLEDYKSRIEKAIEYINNGYLSDGEMFNILAQQELLNILKGE